MKSNQKPFFSKFLEAQKIEKTKDLKGGCGKGCQQTQKYPSDGDEGGEETH